VSDARQTCTRISSAEDFDPALEMKAEAFSIRRCQKDVIC
jgi:hypothetical protein